ncbi:MAG: MtrB/PioB family outer membrane beta-barrel protein [Acidobacteriia bacterium]|nr:MtrB/PioB family outer membrane beta-barrel protein [Terriglobia bacterium]
MKTIKQLAAFTVFAILCFPAGLFAQEEKAPEHGTIDFGLRFAAGDVDGRPDLLSGQCLGCGSPFDPSLKTSKYNEYRDIRNGFFIRRLDFKFENVLGSKNNYMTLQSQKSLFKDQSYLATYGSYGKFKIQFRYDEIPHTYSNTARTLFTETSPGVWRFPDLIRKTLQSPTTSAANLPSVINTQVVTDFNFITPAILRRAGSLLFSYNPTAEWSLTASFWRESEKGNRPIGLIMNSSPSASASSGYGVELPEPINYFNNRLQFGAEYGRQSWAFQAGYFGSFFQNNVGTLTWDNPFRLTLESAGNPLTGRMDLYPDNQAHYLNFAAGADVGKYVRVTGSVTPGWLRQNDLFLPYSTNTALLTCGDGTQACTSIAALPVARLEGNKQTLAMNFSGVTTMWKKVQAKASYRHYDYNNNTPVHSFTPAEGDSAAPALDPITLLPVTTENTPFGYNRKNLELSGSWYFSKRSAFKLGYEKEWMDRVHRDAEHSVDNSIFTAVDFSPNKDLLFRLSYRHSDRKPEVYLDDVSLEISGGIPVDSPLARRFDQAARLEHRADGLVQYNFTDKLTASAFAGTLQDDYNRAGESNSATPLNFLTGAAATTNPYYLYGLLKDISYNYGVNLDYALSTQVTLFAEYSREQYHKRMISRYRGPESTTLTANPNGCGTSSNGLLYQGPCDSPNNDWESTANERVDILAAGADAHFGKKTYLTAYYTLSAAKGNVNSAALGTQPANFLTSPTPVDPTPLALADRFMLTTTNAAVDYPETVNRSHEFTVMFRYKLTDRLTPKFEYRYQQWDYKDYQTSAMTQYMGCVATTGVPAVLVPQTPSVSATVAPGCPSVGPTAASSISSPYYPYFVVGDPSAARYLFLGVDQPSYKAHYVSFTLEYRF